MKAIIRNSFYLLFSFSIAILQCKAQVREGNYKFTHNEKFKSGSVISENYGVYKVFFEKEGEMLGGCSFKSDSLSMQYRIILDNSKIKFKEKYQFIVDNYSGKNDISFILKKINAITYELSFSQMPKRIILDNIYFKKNKNGLYCIYRMENFTYGSDGNTQICPYSLSRIKDSIIDLHTDLYNSTDSLGEANNCFEENYLKLLDGEKISIPKSMGILATLKIDSIQIKKGQIKAEISNNCGEGNFILKNENEINLIPSKKIRNMIYTQYKTTGTEPTSFAFTQEGKSFYLNMYDEKSINEFCGTGKDETLVIANIIIFKIYTYLYNYNLIVVDNIDKVISY